MDDLQGKIESVLSSPETMDKIKSILGALSAGDKDAPESERRAEPEPTKEAESSSDSPAADSLSSLLGGLGNLSALSSLDPKLISGLMGLLSEYNRRDDERENLLRALKPYLRTERREKLERAAHLMKLARTARSGFSLFMGDDGHA